MPIKHTVLPIPCIEKETCVCVCVEGGLGILQVSYIVKWPQIYSR